MKRKKKRAQKGERHKTPATDFLHLANRESFFGETKVCKYGDMKLTKEIKQAAKGATDEPTVGHAHWPRKREPIWRQRY